MDEIWKFTYFIQTYFYVKDRCFSIEFPAVLATSDPFPKIRSRRIEEDWKIVPRSRGIIPVEWNFPSRIDIRGPDTNIVQHCSRPGKSINAPSPQTDLSLAWPIYRPVERRIPLFAIQYNSPSTGPPPFFPKPSPSSEGSRRHCREELLPKGREGKGRRILYVAGIPRTLCKCGSGASPVLPLLPGVSFRVYHLSGSDLSRTRSLLGHVHSFAIFGIVKLCLPRRHASNRVVSIN